MAWKRTESHTVGGYVFHWFTDGGGWIAAVWSEGESPEEPSHADIARALTVLRPPLSGKEELRGLCMRFVENIPYRIRAIRGKTTALRRLGMADIDL